MAARFRLCGEMVKLHISVGGSGAGRAAPKGAALQCRPTPAARAALASALGVLMVMAAATSCNATSGWPGAKNCPGH